MIGGVQGSNSNSLFNIGNVGIYSQNLVKSAMAESDGSLSGVMGKIGSLGIGNGYQNQISSTTKNTLSFASENAKNLNGLKNAAYGLSRAATNFGASTLTSTNDKVLTASGTSYSSSTAKYDVTVSQIATQQQQSSQSLSSSAASAFGAGTNSFNIRTDKGSFEINFDVNTTDTNQQAMDKIASSINSSQAGVTAKVVTQDGKSSLQMTSTATGEQSAFSIEAGNTGRDASAALGMKETQAAQNAKYSMNGQQFSSASNTVSMPDGRAGTMTFKGTGSASVSRQVDSSGVVAAAEQFAKSYNTAVEYLAKNPGGGKGTDRALAMIDGVGSSGDRTLARLSSIGITIGEKGMQVDTAKLTKAVQENPSSVKSTLGGYGGVAEKVERGAASAMRIPAATYTDFSKMQVQSGLLSSLMPQSSGFLFDLYR